MTPIQVSQASGQTTIKQEPTDSTTQIVGFFQIQTTIVILKIIHIFFCF